MAQQRSAIALEPFLALVPSATSPRAAVELITRATSAPHAYSFAELLQKPNIQILRTAESEHYRAHLKLLEIFAWGTWQDYSSTPNLPKLNTDQEEKLRLLSLLSLVSPNASSPSTPISTSTSTSTSASPSRTSAMSSSTRPTLSYTALQAALSLPSASALESLATTAIHTDILFATLDPAAGVIAVRSVAPVRDLPPNSIAGMKRTTEAWITRCDDVAKGLEDKVEEVLARARERARRETDLERRLELAVDKGDLKGVRGDEGSWTGRDMGVKAVLEREGGAGGHAAVADEMDIDDAGGIGGAGGAGGANTRATARPRAKR